MNPDFCLPERVWRFGLHGSPGRTRHGQIPISVLFPLLFPVLLFLLDDPGVPAAFVEILPV